MRASLGWVVLVCGACGGGSAREDAVTADGVVTDAMIDAAGGCPAGTDQDGDGICDADDVCPTIQDPGQFDLDGDGFGWACDDKESITIPRNLSGSTLVSLFVDTEPFVAAFTECGPCQGRRFVWASAEAGAVVTYDSPGDPAWLGAEGIRILDVSAFGEAYMQRFTPDTVYDYGRFNPSTRDYEPVGIPVDQLPRNVHDGAQALLFNLGVPPTALYELSPSVPPRLVGTADEFESSTGFPDDREHVIAGSPPAAYIPFRTGTAYSLKRFVSGSDITDLPTGGPAPGPWSTLLYVARTNDTLFYVARRADNAQWELLIVGHDTAVVRPLPGLPTQLEPIRDGVLVVVRDAANVYSLEFHDFVTSRIEIAGESALAINSITGSDLIRIDGTSGSGLKTAWIVRPDGSATFVGRDLHGFELRSKRDVVAILENRLDSSPRGSSTYFHRYRVDGPDEEGLVESNQFPNQNADAFSLAHDGSIIVIPNVAYVAKAIPAGSSTPVVLADPAYSADCERTTTVTLCMIQPDNLSSTTFVRAYHDAALQDLSPELTGAVRALSEGSEDGRYFLYPVSLTETNRTVFLPTIAAGGSVSVVSIYDFVGHSESGLGRNAAGDVVMRFLDPTGTQSTFILLSGQTVTPITRSSGISGATWWPMSGPIRWIDGWDGAAGYRVSVDRPERAWSMPPGQNVRGSVADTEVHVADEGTLFRVTIFRPRQQPDFVAPL
jgi:hypothetical protein